MFFFLLLVLPLALPVAALAALARLVAHVVATLRRRSARHLLGPGTLLLAALALACVAGTAYSWGFASGTYVLDPEEVCGIAWGEHPARGVHWESYLPLSAHCASYPGAPDATQLIPAWANPVTATASAAALALALAAPFAARLRRAGVAEPPA
ncbi:hypothetical protein OOK31_31240 [Streptomyces sp. NBC_00249]|uniref:hypothetical protein n=1 Tax=Streptomyces sp. NBC_00249 TaxID=2975690 RepID=UPI00224F1827|nr:hypothetical protein [Streptomyces sp. NBC_00249]MCX5198312.1 hypothetical protein [Streptomyces sp. NBC_00249]